MWTPSYDIIVETLTGSEFEVTVNDRDTVGYLKSEIQKYEGIPVSQQHLLYNNKELSDAMEMKDIPLVKGSRVKLVLGMKGGPISSKRLFTISSDYDNWLDMSDVFSGDDLINLQSPGLKLLLYKDNKKNVHRLMKVRAEKAGDGMKGSLSRSVIGSGASGQSSGYHTSQKDREAAMTMQKMDQIKAKLSMKKKSRLGAAQAGDNAAEDVENPAERQQRNAELLADDRRSECASIDTDGKKSRSQGQHRHKKRHHHQHFHHHHHHHHQQHDTVIKEEKTPIGYRPGASSGSARGGDGHNSPMVGAIGSMLPGTTAGAHRKSMPAVIDVARQDQEPAAPPYSYGLVNVLHGSTATTATSRAPRTPSLELEKRSQIREHLQRNRSFKTISAKNLDFTRDAAQMGGGGAYGHGGSTGLERSLSFHSNGILNRMSSETTLDGGYAGSSIRRCTTGQPRAAGVGQSRIGDSGGCTTTQSLHQLDEKVSSASLHDLIELLKYTHSKQRTISNDSLNKLVLNYSKKMYMPHLYHHAVPGAGAKKSLPDINPSLNNIDEYLPDFDLGIVQAAATGGVGGGGGGGAVPKGVTTRNDEDERSCKIASAEIAFKNAAVAGTLGGTIDKTYRTLCKSISDDSSVYELPKLLVREDSPVESFLGSYSQLETVALRGDSPKNNFTSTSSLQDVGGGTLDDPSTATMSESLLELRPLPTKSSASIVSEAKRASESLLQLAQIAAESVKSSSVTPPAAAASGISSGKLFGSNGSLTAGATNCSAVSSAAPGSNGFTSGSNSSSNSSWCHHWNQRQNQQPQHTLQHGPFSSSLQQLSSHPRHHHSDLGINELELKFVHADSLDRAGDEEGCCDASRNVIKLPAIPHLEINTSWQSSWDTLRYTRDDEDADDEALDDEEVCGPEGEVDGHVEENAEDEEVQEDQERVTSSSCSSIRRPHRGTATSSTSFIHSHLSISSDEDDLLNVSHELGGTGSTGGGGGSAGPGGSYGAYKAGGNKSKSIDLNEFRKAFGSSPTLLHGFGGVGTSCTRLVPQLSRLETIPSQYRRGYTNLNDACLSSSTSELECVSNGAAKKKHHAGGGLLPPEDDRSVISSALSKYRKNGNIPYVRSNENLNRHKVSLCGAPSSSAAGSAERRRSGDSETLGTGDALYLRHRQQSASSAGAGAIGGTRHLPGIRDHLASIADSELSDSVGCGSSNNSRHNSTGSILNEDDDIAARRCFAVGGDFECRFSRLSCCSSTTAAASKSVSPGGGVNGHYHRHHGPGLPTMGSGGGSALRAATSSSSVPGDHNHRMLFGDDGRSSMQRVNAYDGTAGAPGAPTTTNLRSTDYYFPSDESLFNMDSFFDDFVEIDTSDIFDSAEFININAPGVAGCKAGSGNSLLLPDIHQQQQQQQPHQQEQQQQSSPYHCFHVKEQGQQRQQQLLLNTAPSGASGKPFSRLLGLRGGSYDFCSELPHSGSRAAFLHPRNVEDDEEDEDDDEDDEGIASIIQQIDREQLCDQRASPSSSAAAAPSRSASSSVAAVRHGKRHAASSERLLRLLNQLPSNPSHSAAMAVPAPLSGELEKQQPTTEQIKSKKLRCAQCNKKLGMVMVMKCHCEQIFCAQHRYAEAHNCSYDFKLEGRKVLEKNNPLVVAEKLPKI